MIECCLNFKLGDRVKFPTKDGFEYGTVERESTDEWPLKVVADKPVWRLSADEIKFWHDGNKEEADMAARTFYLYKLNGRNLSPEGEKFLLG